MPDPDWAILQRFHGSPEHREILQYCRNALIADLATIMNLPAGDPQLGEIHRRLRLRLELLVDLRLDDVDLKGLATQAVSQFETILPSRVEMSDRLRDDGHTLA